MYHKSFYYRTMNDCDEKNHNNQDNHSKITVQTNRKTQSRNFASNTTVHKRQRRGRCSVGARLVSTTAVIADFDPQS
jgi:PDZ domain-containing secreted protein